jgi:hypothetical protein
MESMGAEITCNKWMLTLYFRGLAETSQELSTETDAMSAGEPAYDNINRD